MSGTGWENIFNEFMKKSFPFDNSDDKKSEYFNEPEI
jgi:hypothetical protein